MPEWYEIESWIITWAPIIFMGLLVFFIWRTMKLMPRTKPQQIKPESRLDRLGATSPASTRPRPSCAEVVEFLRDPKRFAELGAQVPKGILLHGPPGTGKTLLAKAVAARVGRAVLLAVGGVVRRDVRRPRRRAHPAPVRRGAQAARPAIIFIDELDAVGARRGSDNNSEREQTLNQLLVEMDGFSSTGDLVVIAASNLLEKLDPALLRPGPLRPPGLRLAARRRAAARRSSRSTRAPSRSARTSTSRRSRARRPA